MSAVLAATPFVGQNAASPGGIQPEAHLEFEVASIRPHDPGVPGMHMNLTPPVVEFTNLNVANLIQMALGVNSFQLKGGPTWIHTDRFDLEARTPDALSAAPVVNQRVQIRTMLLSLLRERFHFRYHLESKEETVYWLEVAARKPSLTPSAPNEPFSYKGGGGKDEFRVFSMERLAGQLTGDLGQVVMDKTGMSGVFDFNLEYGSPEHSPGQVAGTASPSVDLRDALLSQLGLKLVPQHQPMPAVYIDAVDHPTAN